jgi:hypothetical protein
MALPDVFSELRVAQERGVFDAYAIGGAIGATFYLEPAATEHVDVFVTLPQGSRSALVSLEPIYRHFRERGASVEGEHLVIKGWQVQLLPAPSDLEIEALEHAVTRDVDGIAVPVFGAEYLAAIALKTGRLKDKVRLRLFLEFDKFDRPRVEEIVERHGLHSDWTRAQQFLQENP